MAEYAEEVREPRGRPVRSRVVVPVYLREDLARGLRQLAEQRDCSQSMVIREAVARVVREAGL